MTSILTPPGTGETESKPARRRWVAVLVVLLLVATAVGVWALWRDDGSDVAVPETVVPSAPAEEEGAVPEESAAPEQPKPTPAADCSVAPGREYYSVGATHPCFPLMGERFQVWLGGAIHRTGATYEPSQEFTTADVANVRAVQLLMDDVPDGWFGPGQWTRLTTGGPPPVTQIRASGIGPLWYGMTAEQVAATGVASVATTEEGVSYLAVDGITGAGCYLPSSSGGGVITAYLTSDPAVSTPEGITPRSSVEQVLATYGNRLSTRVEQVTTEAGSQDVTVYVLPQGDFALAMWSPPADVGPDSPLVLASGTRAMVDDLRLQSGWCMD